MTGLILLKAMRDFSSVFKSLRFLGWFLRETSFRVLIVTTMGSVWSTADLISALSQLHNDSGFPSRIEGIDQAERCEKEDKYVENNVGNCNCLKVESKVPGPGIEPGTRGFSVLCSTD